MAVGEQAQNRCIIGDIESPEFFTRGDRDTVETGLPFTQKVAVIRAHPARIRRQEIPASASQGQFNPVAVIEIDQLGRDILTTRRGVLVRYARFPVARQGVGIPARRRGMGQAGRGDDPGCHAQILGAFGQGQRRAIRILADIEKLVRPNRHHTTARTHAGGDGGGRTGTFRDLHVGIIGLDQGHVGKGLEGENIGFSILTPALPVINARGRDGRDTHAIGNEENDILRSLRAHRNRRPGLHHLPGHVPAAIGFALSQSR